MIFVVRIEESNGEDEIFLLQASCKRAVLDNKLVRNAAGKQIQICKIPRLNNGISVTEVIEMVTFVNAK